MFNHESCFSWSIRNKGTISGHKWNRETRQCAGKVKMKRVRATIFAMDEQWVFIMIMIIIITIIVCPYSWFSFPTCKAHVPYYIVISICVPSDCTIFFILSHKRHDFRKKKLLNINGLFWFSHSDSMKNSASIIISVRRSSYKIPVILVRS